MNTRLLPAVTAVALLTLPPAATAATPCETPEQFVRGARLPATNEAPAPLVRPYVVAGMAAVAVAQHDGDRWLELAAHSADDARRQLAVAPASPWSGAGQLASWGDRVWLRCPARAGEGAGLVRAEAGGAGVAPRVGPH